MKGTQRFNDCIRDLTESAETIFELDRVLGNTDYKLYKRDCRQGLALSKQNLYRAVRELFEELDLRETQEIRELLDELEDKQMDKL